MIRKATSRRIYLVVILVLWPLTPYIFAATVRLANGKVFRGEIVAETTQALQVKTALGIIKFPRREVVRLENDEARNRDHCVGQVLDYIESGNFPEAFQTLQRIRSTTDASELAATDRLLLEKFNSIAEFAKAQPQIALTALSDYVLNRPTPPPPSLFAKTFDLTISTRETSNALTLLVVALRRGWNSLCDLDLLAKAIEVCQSNEDVSAGDRLLIAAAAAKTADGNDPVGQSIEAKALSVVAGGILDLLVSHRESALREPLCQLSECDLTTSFSAREMESLFRQLISLAHSQNSTGTLVICYEWIENKAGLAPQFEVTHIVRDHHSLLLRHGDFHAARELAMRWESRDPDLAAELFLQTDFFEQKARLAADDLVAHYSLAKWAYKMGLRELALEEFRRLSTSKQVGRASYLYLKANKIQRHAEALQHALALFRLGLYSAAARQAEELAQTQEKSDLTTEAAVVAALSKRLADTAPQRERLKAASLLQQAERLALRQDYPAAASCLKKVQNICPSREISTAVSVLMRRFPQLAAHVHAHEGN